MTATDRPLTKRRHFSPRALTRFVRSRVPEQVVDTSRRVLHAWGSATADLRMKPSLLVVGAQRCGTTTLFRLLSEHPQVARPTASKGSGYFDINYEQPLSWYLGHFPLRATGRALGYRITFESSGYYSFHPLAAERIAAALPDVKVAMMVRDPVERAYSAYKHEFARGFETETFERAIALESERLEGEEERMRVDSNYRSFSHRHHAYLRRGQYAEQVRRFLDAIGAERIHLVDADAFFVDPRQEFGRLTDWLNLNPWLPDRVQQWNARRSAPMSDAIRGRLEQHFAPHDRELSNLLGRSFSWM